MGGPSATGARPPVRGAVDNGRQRPATRPQPGAPGTGVDSPVNATAARLIAEGRARMADSPDEDETPDRKIRRGQGARQFDLASLAALPTEYRERAIARWKRRRVRIATYTPRERMWHRVRVAGATATGLFVVLPILMFLIGYLAFAIPTEDDAVKNQVATISFSDDTQLAKIVPADGNRIKVQPDQVPLDVQHAVLSAEDRSFYSNPGFDPMGLARAVVKQLTGQAGGGSTITQQFVKKTLVGDEHSLWRKYKEMILAIKISQRDDKPTILTNYLNAIYFGRGAYGIQAASQAYFKKNVWELNASEGALLAGVIQSPNRWDPAKDLQRSVQRWNYVMDGMVTQGWLDKSDRAADQFPRWVPSQKTSSGIPSDDRGLIVSAVRDELATLGINETTFNQDGLQIETTIDPVAQRDAVDAVHKGLDGQPDNLRSALVSVDPRNGAIKAYYGGSQGTGLDYARVSKQPGSTFKPFTLLAGLIQQDPVGLGERFKGMPLPGLRNADGASCPVCDLKQAMTISNNVVYVSLAEKVGPRKVLEAAKTAGLADSLSKVSPDTVDSRIALGNKEVTPVELAGAYATFAAKGIYHKPHLVSKVTTADDRVIYLAPDRQEERFDPQVARNVTEGMLGVPTYDKLSLSKNRPVAAKTGTVQSYVKDQNNDAWTAGFTPQMATVVWIGTDQNTPIKNSKGAPISGGTMPAGIWKSYMGDATKSDDVENFGPFKAIGEPPAVTGPTDGFMAGGGGDSSDTSTSTPPTTTLESAPVDGAVDNNARGTTRRECGNNGCHDVKENGTDNNRRSDSDESDNADDSDR